MRSRNDIENMVDVTASNVRQITMEAASMRLTLEVLLDIRDILLQKEKDKRVEEPDIATDERKMEAQQDRRFGIPVGPAIVDGSARVGTIGSCNEICYSHLGKISFHEFLLKMEGKCPCGKE